MKKLLIIAVVCLYGTAILYAQGELDEQQKVFFRNERSYAILLNSDGLGLSYREAKRNDYLNKRLFEFDLGILKHPKEYKITNPFYTGTTAFVFGKLNRAFYIRAGIGRQHEIFKKEDLGGIAIRYFWTAGPAIVAYRPIYYQVINWQTTSKYIIEEKKFDIAIHSLTDILGKASFLKGFNETKVLPGLYAKGGFNFEYSKEDKIIHSIECGAQINAFTGKVPIMASPDNKAIFFSLFVSYRFGIIVDPLHPEDTKLSNLFKKKKE